MNFQKFVVAGRTRLAYSTEFPKLDFADYQRCLASLQGVLPLIQQAYPGRPERAIIVRHLGSALDPRSFKVHPIAHWISAGSQTVP